MIRLVVVGAGALQLDDATLTLEISNPFFQDDAIPGTTSDPFALRFTRDNLRQLGFPQLFRGAGGPPPVPADLYLDGPLWRRGVLVYRDCDEQKQVLTYNFAADAADLQKQIAGVHLPTLALGTVDLVLTPAAAEYALLPIRNTAFFGDKNPAYKGIINYFRAGSYVLGASQVFCPQPRLVPTLRRIFAAFGYELTGDWLDEAEVQQLVIYSDRAAQLADGSVAPTFELAHHLPDMTVGELLIALQQFFRLGFDFHPTLRQVRVRALRDVLARRDVVVRTGAPLTSQPNDTNGWLLKFAPEGEDELDKTLDTSWQQLRVGAGGETTEVKAGTLHQVRELDRYQSSREWLVPAIEAKGASLAYELGDDSRCGLRLLFDRGLQPDSQNDLYPLGGVGSVNYRLAPVGRYSLQWDGTSGLYQQWHRGWLDFRSRAVRSEWQVDFRLTDLLNLDSGRPDLIGRHYQLWEKVSLTIDAQRRLATARITYQEIL